jgi:hypothetical protein
MRRTSVVSGDRVMTRSPYKATESSVHELAWSVLFVFAGQGIRSRAEQTTSIVSRKSHEFSNCGFQ